MLKENKDIKLLDERVIWESMDTALRICYERK